jgi:DeoR/GlpR family transcriptional regulator of sugar metabolism
MLREQRQQAILDEMERAGSVSVAALSEKLDVSDMTVRRDVEEFSARNVFRSGGVDRSHRGRACSSVAKHSKQEEGTAEPGVTTPGAVRPNPT